MKPSIQIDPEFAAQIVRAERVEWITLLCSVLVLIAGLVLVLRRLERNHVAVPAAWISLAFCVVLLPLFACELTKTWVAPSVVVQMEARRLP